MDDGTHLQLAGEREFTWHVTCVRYPDESKRNDLRAAAAGLTTLIGSHPNWTIDTIAWLELRGDRYESMRTWTVDSEG